MSGRTAEQLAAEVTYLKNQVAELSAQLQPKERFGGENPGMVAWWHTEPLRLVDLDIHLSSRQRDYVYERLKRAYTDGEGRRMVKIEPDAVRHLLAIADVHEMTCRVDALAVVGVVRDLLAGWHEMMELKCEPLRAYLVEQRKKLAAAMAICKHRNPGGTQ